MDTRSRILENALILFSEKGYDGTGTQEIVDKSGITKPTLYHYFGSKLGLLETLLREKTTDHIAALENTTEYHGDLVLTLTKIVRLYFDFAGKEPVFYRFLTGLNFTAPGSKASQMALETWRRQYGIINDMFIKAAGQHGNLKGKNNTLTFTFIGMINNYVTLFLQGSLELKENSIHQAVKQYMHGIFS
ncbi:MAG: TetR/AcrR family transcriptional regulator [Spirochaetales bacterium]|nr:TetR/AcrR family transcriptional regulator [Spirochaetales bacterium]